MKRRGKNPNMQLLIASRLLQFAGVKAAIALPGFTWQSRGPQIVEAMIKGWDDPLVVTVDLGKRQPPTRHATEAAGLLNKEHQIRLDAAKVFERMSNPTPPKPPDSWVTFGNPSKYSDLLAATKLPYGAHMMTREQAEAKYGRAGEVGVVEGVSFTGARQNGKSLPAARALFGVDPAKGPDKTVLAKLTGKTSTFYLVDEAGAIDQAMYDAILYGTGHARITKP